MKTWSAFVVSVVLFAGACDKGDKGKGGAAGGGAPAIAQKDGSDGLKDLFAASHAACTSKEFAKGKAIVMGMLPTTADLKKIFKDDVAAAKLDEVAAQYKEVPPSEEKVACLFYPGQGRTEIRVHKSSVADLVAYKEGTPAFEEFPGGAKKLAETVLRPEGTFYEVEVTEPGKDMGTKYHMLFWDGAQWKMLGPVWRNFRD